MVTEEKDGGDSSDHDRNDSGSLDSICIDSKGDANDDGKMSPADEAKPVSGERRRFIFEDDFTFSGLIPQSSTLQKCFI